MLFDSLEFFTTFFISISWIFKLVKSIYWDREHVTSFDELVLALFFISIFGVFSYQRHFIVFTCFSMIFTTFHALNNCIRVTEQFYYSSELSCAAAKTQLEANKCYYRELVFVGIAQLSVVISITAVWLSLARLIKSTPAIQTKPLPVTQMAPLPYGHTRSHEKKIQV